MIRSVGIVGYGSFGAFLGVLAQKYLPTIEVKVFSRSRTLDEQLFFSLEEVCACDVLILTVPVDVFKETLTRVLPLVRKETIVVDVATVKKYTSEILDTHKDSLYYIATHPMFGPFSYAKKEGHLEGLRIVITDYHLPDGMYATACDLLRGLGFIVLEFSADDHDKMLAETLFLTHLVSQTIVGAQYRRTEIDTVSFGFLMNAVESVCHDIDLFRSVYKYNPYCKDVLEHYTQSVIAMGEDLKK